LSTLPLYVFAFCSGYAALVYQVAWSRMLSLTFGSTTLAVSAVVAGFMGGMGIGAWLYHRVGDRVRVPLKGYGLLEIGIAFSTAFFTLLFIPLPEWFAAASAFVPAGIAGNIFRIATAFMLLILPSALMGATYPALCQSLLHSAKDVDTRLGWIYGLNTLGAATGALGAGFVMIEMLGSHGSVTAANFINLAVGAVALMLARKEVPGTGSSTPSSDESLPSDLPIWLAGFVLFASGFATLGYEIVWFRALRYLLGNGTYVLSAVLVIFLIGLGLGGLLYRVAVRFGKPEWNLGISQIVIAILALLAILCEQYVLINPDLSAQVHFLSLSVDALPWQTRLAMGFGLAVAIMLPATICMGLAFPLASRLFLGSVKDLTSRVGLAYLISNLGSIAGAILAATWILPTLGTGGGTTFLAAINGPIGLFVLMRAPRVSYRVVGMVLIVIAGVIAIGMPKSLAFFAPPGSELAFVRESDLGTVQVITRTGAPDALGMLVDNTLVGATQSYFPMLYRKQRIIAHLPMILDRNIRDTLNLGVATGSTIKALSRYPWVESLDAVEINSAVIDAGAFFFDTTALRDRRATLYVEDAVHYLLRTRKKYDLIINDAKQSMRFEGNAKILSEELYRYSIAALNDCGMFVQYLPLEGSADLLRLILRTFTAVFPESEVFMESSSRLIAVGSRCPIGGREGPTRRELMEAGVAKEIEALYVPDATQLPATWMASGHEIAQVVGEGPTNSWDKLPLEFLAYRASTYDVRSNVVFIEMILEQRIQNPKGVPAFTDNPYFEPLLELQNAWLEWAHRETAAAIRRVDRVLAEHPDLALARNTKLLVESFKPGNFKK
jgi:spermidine synthase